MVFWPQTFGNHNTKVTHKSVNSVKSCSGSWSERTAHHHVRVKSPTWALIQHFFMSSNPKMASKIALTQQKYCFPPPPPKLSSAILLHLKMCLKLNADHLNTGILAHFATDTFSRNMSLLHSCRKFGPGAGVSMQHHHFIIRDKHLVRSLQIKQAFLNI